MLLTKFYVVILKCLEYTFIRIHRWIYLLMSKWGELFLKASENERFISSFYQTQNEYAPLNRNKQLAGSD